MTPAVEEVIRFLESERDIFTKLSEERSQSIYFSGFAAGLTHALKKVKREFGAEE